jgi:glyoxylase-like metal-dependent hydrolase (beta-lactamase superfamily II)
MVDDMLFSGDSLYARRTALSRLPGEEHAVLRASLIGLFSWVGADIRVLPGHGGSATVDEIVNHNEELRAFMAAGSTQ